MEPKVLFEDEYVLVIDKPSGVVVDRATTVKNETIQDWLENNFQFPVFKYYEMRNGIVHRLDKETSGVLLIAKTPEAHKELQRQFKDREIEKTYTSLVHGKLTPEEGIIDKPVGRLPWNRERFGVLEGGREAVTGYRVIKNYKLEIKNQFHNSQFTIPDSYSLVEFYPKTGRTHQIRIHAKEINHPVVGDTFYAGRKTARNDRKWCPRLFLHASQINFTHPITREKMTIGSVLPEDLQTALIQLEKS